MVDRQTSAPDFERLISLLNGYRATCVIVAAVEIGLVDRLREGSVSTDALVTSLNVDRDSLHRLMRALIVLDLVHEDGPGVSLTATGRLLLENESALSHRAAVIAGQYLPSWGKLARSVATGQPAFPEIFGMNAWEHRAQHPDLSESFNRMMVDDQARSRGALFEAYDFSLCRVLVDVGGGQGQVVAEMLARYPHARGVLFDQPGVIGSAKGFLTRAGVINRCQLVAGSFFEAVPASGDTYVLQHILHDWNDDECVQILRNCRDAMSNGATLLVVENHLAEAGKDDPHVAMLDLHMMVILGGRERTRTEYEALLAEAGLSPLKCLPTSGNAHVLVARREC